MFPTSTAVLILYTNVNSPLSSGQIKIWLGNSHRMHILLGLKGMHKLCCCSVTKSSLTLWFSWTSVYQASLSYTISWSLLRFMSIESVMPFNSNTVAPFSSCPKSFSASRSFPMSQLFTSVGQSIGVSASASVLPMNIQDWFPLGWTGLISLQSKGLSGVFSSTTGYTEIKLNP